MSELLPELGCEPGRVLLLRREQSALASQGCSGAGTFSCLHLIKHRERRAWVLLPALEPAVWLLLRLGAAFETEMELLHLSSPLGLVPEGHSLICFQKREKGQEDSKALMSCH